MMSESAKRNRSSTLRSSDVVEQVNLEHARAEGSTEHEMSAAEDGQECRGVPPVWCAHTERIRALVRLSAMQAEALDGVLRREGRPRRFEIGRAHV